MTKDYSMVSSHSVKEKTNDSIFMTNSEAQKAIKKYGADEVINASIGALMDDNGKLCTIPSVMTTLRELNDSEIIAYAPIAGTPEFLDKVIDATFRDCKPEGYFSAVATPGGSGAVRNTIWNYSEVGDTILTADWYWGPYKTISEENLRKFDTFKLFDDNFNFNIKSFEEKVDEILGYQKRLVILLNSPSNNPTGYNISDEEWDKIICILKDRAKSNINKITLFIDIAYIEYSDRYGHGREFMKKFSNLPWNILTVFGFSMSKGYTFYGLRCGAMVCLSSSKEIAAEFKNANEYSSRGVWSNGTRSAMTVLSKIFSDKALLKKVDSERNKLKKLLFDRANAFIEESKKVGLKTCPYKSGFFISIPCENSKEVSLKLREQNIFIVPIPKGLRFAICSVPEEKCRKVPKILKSVLG